MALRVLAAHLHDGVALGGAAAQAGVAPRTARRWLARYRSGGLVALAPASRTDRGQRRTTAALIELIEGQALRRRRRRSRISTARWRSVVQRHSASSLAGCAVAVLFDGW